MLDNVKMNLRQKNDMFGRIIKLNDSKEDIIQVIMRYYYYYF